jgi:hypothetical protein
MVSETDLNWMLKTLDAGGSVPGWSLRIVKETYFLTREEDGATWIKDAGRARWKAQRGRPGG